MHEAISSFEGICLEGIVERDILGADKPKRTTALGSSITVKQVCAFLEGYVFVTNASGEFVLSSPRMSSYRGRFNGGHHAQVVRSGSKN